MKKSIVLCLLLAAFATRAQQFPRVDIPGSEVRKISSSVVDQEYELHILLPRNHHNSLKKFPVVYLMDSQWDFPLLKSIYGQQYYDGFIPDLIIVGITWGGTRPNPDSLRARDYTPSKEPGTIQSGGADKFLQFMRTELFPFIETNYKADPAHRTIAGCSLGGLITLYALFTQPDMFTGYIAASPAIQWDREILFRYEKKFSATNPAKPVRVYMTVGDVEQSRMAFERFANVFSGKKQAGVSIHAKVLENTGHSGTKSETYSRGLQFVFERPQLKLPAIVLDRYAGRYKTESGNTVEIKNENGSLVIYTGQTEKLVLFAASETNFYLTSQYFKLSYQKENGREGFRLETYGGSQFVARVNEPE